MDSSNQNSTQQIQNQTKNPDLVASEINNEDQYSQAEYIAPAKKVKEQQEEDKRREEEIEKQTQERL